MLRYLSPGTCLHWCARVSIKLYIETHDETIAVQVWGDGRQVSLQPISLGRSHSIRTSPSWELNAQRADSINYPVEYNTRDPRLDSISVYSSSWAKASERIPFARSFKTSEQHQDAIWKAGFPVPGKLTFRGDISALRNGRSIPLCVMTRYLWQSTPNFIDNQPIRCEIVIQCRISHILRLWHTKNPLFYEYVEIQFCKSWDEPTICYRVVETGLSDVVRVFS